MIKLRSVLLLIALLFILFTAGLYPVLAQGGEEAVITPLQAVGKIPLWSENFTGGSVDHMQMAWARHQNEAMVSFVMPGVVYLGQDNTQIPPPENEAVEHELNNFKQVATETLPSTVEFDILNPTGGNARISLRPRRQGDFAHLRLGLADGTNKISFRFQPGDSTTIFYDLDTTNEWIHVIASYRQYEENGTRYAHYVVALNEEVREITSTSGITPAWETYFNNTSVSSGVDAWSFEYDSTDEVTVGRYLANIRAYEGFITKTALSNLITGQITGYLSTLPDPTLYTGPVKLFEVHKELETFGPNAMAYADQVDWATVKFDGSLSSSWKRLWSYNWNFGDGMTGTGRLVNHTYAQAGSYQTQLTVTNNYGSDVHTVTVHVRGSDISPNYTPTTLPGTQLILPYTLTNLTAISDTFALTATIDLPGWGVIISPTTVFSLTGNESQLFTAVVDVPPDALVNATANLSLWSVSQIEPVAVVGITNTITVAGVRDVVLSGGEGVTSLPTETVIFNHTVTNTGNISDAFEVSFINSTPWSTTLALTSTGWLNPNETTIFTLTTQLPADAWANQQAFIAVTARSQISPIVAQTVTNQVTVGVVRSLLLTANQNGVALPGETIIFNHWLTNTSNITDNFNLSLLVDKPGWSATVSPTTTILPPDASALLTVAVHLPVEAVGDTLAMVTLSAESESDPLVNESNTDLASVATVYSLTLTLDQDATVLPGETVTFTHLVTNTSNTTDTINVMVNATLPVSFTPAAIVNLPPGASATVTITATVSPTAWGNTQEIISLTAQSEGDNSIEVTRVDTITVAVVQGVILARDQTALAFAGNQVVFQHTITNTGNLSANFNITLTGPWPVTSAPAVINQLPPLAMTHLTLTTTVPISALAGTQGVFTAHIQSPISAAIQATNVDTVTVEAERFISLTANQTTSVLPGETAIFSHTLTNLGNISDDFMVTEIISVNGEINPVLWPVTIWPPFIDNLAPNESTSITVSLQVPLEAPAYREANVKLTVQSQTNAALKESNTDTVQVKAQSGLHLTANQMTTTLPGEVVHFSHILTNTGNISDDIALNVTLNVTGSVNLPLAGNRAQTLTFTQWLVTLPVTQVYQLGPGQSKLLTVTVQVPQNASAYEQAIISLQATSQQTPSVTVVNTDSVTVALMRGVALSADQSDKAVLPGSTVYFVHSLTNTGNSPDLFNLMVTPVDGAWPALLNLTSPITLNPLESITVTVTVPVPLNTLDGAIYHWVLQAASYNHETLIVTNTDTITISARREVALSSGQVVTILPGGQFTFEHTVTNTGNVSDTVDLSFGATPPQWSVSLLPDTSGLLGPGQSTTITLQVNVPPGELATTQGVITLTATSQTNQQVQAQVVDTVIVAASSNVALSSGQLITTTPGTTITFYHTMTNTGNLSDMFKVQVQGLPLGWGSTLIPVASDLLAPGVTVPLSLTMQVPITPLLTTATFTITAISQADADVRTSVVDSLVVMTVVQPKSHIYLPVILKNFSAPPEEANSF